MSLVRDEERPHAPRARRAAQKTRSRRRALGSDAPLGVLAGVAAGAAAGSIVGARGAIAGAVAGAVVGAAAALGPRDEAHPIVAPSPWRRRR
jgi:hypothetical protein